MRSKAAVWSMNRLAANIFSSAALRQKVFAWSSAVFVSSLASAPVMIWVEEVILIEVVDKLLVYYVLC